MKIKFTLLLMIAAIAASNVQTVSAQSWSLTGNSGTIVNTNFVGTKDNKAFVFRTNNIERIRISASGNLGIGTKNPLAKLQVENGAFVNLSSPGYFQIGSPAAFNIGMDYEVIQARNNGAASSLFLNYYGGDVSIGSHNAITTPAIYVAPDGRVGIGNSTVNSGYALTVNASSTVPGSIYSSNDGYGDGIDAESFYGNGVFGYSTNAYGVYAYADNSNGLYAVTNNNANYYAGYFVGDVYTSGLYFGSDQKLKQNIKDFSSAMEIINQLHPKQYEFRQDANYKQMNLPQGNHYGLIAQDVEKILPNLVKNSKFETPRKPTTTEQNVVKPETIDYKALNYTELIPIMIKGMQEQQQTIDKQQQVNEQLQTQITELKQIVQSQSQNKDPNLRSPATKASISQNIPNPFNNSTTINYILPQTYSSAKIIITDKISNAIKEINISGNGKGSLKVDASTLASGVYQYSLYVDGKLIDTKQMILAK